MKPLWLVLTVVLALAGALAMAVIASRARSWPDCAGRVVIGKDPRGRPVECVCIEERLSTCFDPGH